MGRVRGGGSPPCTAAVSKHETGTVIKHDKGYCVKARDTLLSQSTRHINAGSNQQTHCCDQSAGTAAVSKHETDTVTRHHKGHCVKARDRLLSQSTRHVLGQTNRHTAVMKVLARLLFPSTRQVL